MANRARDKVIYIRVDEALKKRFDRIKEASGYKGNADFLNYLLDVYDGTCVTMKNGTALIAKKNYPEFVRRYLKYNQRKGNEVR